MPIQQESERKSGRVRATRHLPFLMIVFILFKKGTERATEEGREKIRKKSDTPSNQTNNET